jgi:hypothetical protein
MALKEGDTFIDKGFTSTSTDKGVALQFTNYDSSGFGPNAALIHIKAPKGTKGLDIDKLFDEPFESEVVLPRGTKFTVNSVKGNEIFVSVTNG